MILPSQQILLSKQWMARTRVHLSCSIIALLGALHAQKGTIQKCPFSIIAWTLIRSQFFFYLSLQIILPFVRSYGDISMVTLSPGRIRMKFIRSFPLMVARIWWPFSSSTLKNAFGNFSPLFLLLQSKRMCVSWKSVQNHNIRRIYLCQRQMWLK